MQPFPAPPAPSLSSHSDIFSRFDDIVDAIRATRPAGKRAAEAGDRVEQTQTSAVGYSNASR
jgi:hypothetical protein